MPLDSYLVHVAAISDMVFNKKVTAKNIPELLRKAHEISIAADKELRRINDVPPNE